MATEKRLIDANDIPELLEKEFARKWRLILDGETHLDNLAEGFFSAKNVIWAMPTVDAVEVVHGHWDEDHWEYVCSCCKKHFTDELPWISHPEYGMPNYCPNCGAKMDGDGNG
ncbi:MAG: hypothetical protein J6V25_10380 [Oscillospiraceae bacterium]|nr:hypothetical protein [Oscillospiraceae bacterium]